MAFPFGRPSKRGRAKDRAGRAPRRRRKVEVKSARRGTGKRASRRRRWKGLLPAHGLSVPRTVFAVTVGVSLVLIAIALARPGGILEVFQLTERIGRMRAEMAALRERNAELREEIRRLREDPAAIERIAREDLGLVRPGETVYEFIEEE